MAPRKNISKDYEFKKDVTVDGDLNVGGLIISGSSAKDWKDNVETVATSDITLSGEQTLSGVLTSTSRVGVVGQTATEENCLYITAPGPWTRAEDADEDAEVTNGLAFRVSGAGSTKLGFHYILTTPDPITVGVTGLDFAEHPPGLVDVVDDTTPQYGGTMDSNAHQLRLSKGADIASAATLTPGTDGNYFDVTGTDAITAIADLAIGLMIRLHFDASLVLTHDAADLALPTEANITTQPNDEAEFTQYAAGDWRLTNYERADGTPLVGGAGSRLPLEDRTTTAVDTTNRIPAFSEQLISTHKESGFGPPNKDVFIEFIDIDSGLLTRQVLTDIALDSPSGNGIAYSPDGTLWLRTGDPVKLYRLNPVDGTTVLIGGTTPGTVSAFGTSAMDFHPDGTLYGMQFDLTSFNTVFGHQLVTIDLATGDVTDLGFVTPRGTLCDSFAIKKDPSDPAAFIISTTDQLGQPPIVVPARLHSIDLSTRVLTDIGEITGYEKFSGMVFDSDGTLYATPKLTSSGNKELITINTSTGAATSIGELKFEEQYPAQSNFSLPGLTIRPRAWASSEISFAQLGSFELGHEYGAASAYKVAMHPHPQVLREGMKISFIPGFSSTGSSAVIVNELASVPLRFADGSDTGLNDIVAGEKVSATFISGEFRIDE